MEGDFQVSGAQFVSGENDQMRRWVDRFFFSFFSLLFMFPRNGIAHTDLGQQVTRVWTSPNSSPPGGVFVASHLPVSAKNMTGAVLEVSKSQTLSE